MCADVALMVCAAALNTQAVATPASEAVPATPTPTTADAEPFESVHTPHTQHNLLLQSLPRLELNLFLRCHHPTADRRRCIVSHLSSDNISFTPNGPGRAYCALTAHAMNEHFKVPEMTAYRAADHQHVPRLGMPGRSAPATAYQGVTLYQPHPNDPLHPWRGLN
jgi:hypothetical protein